MQRQSPGSVSHLGKARKPSQSRPKKREDNQVTGHSKPAGNPYLVRGAPVLTTPDHAARSALTEPPSIPARVGGKLILSSRLLQMPTRLVKAARSASPRRSVSVTLAVLAGALYLGVYSLAFRQMMGQWSDDPNYSHGFLVPLVSGYLIWAQRDRLKHLPVQPSYWGTVAVVGGLLLLVLGTLGSVRFLQNVSTVIVLAALVWALLGPAFLRTLAFPLGFLLFFVPLPALVLNQIALPLQLFAAKCAVGTLSLAGVPVLRQGNIVELAGTSLEVAEACSGIRSLQALVALSTVFAYVAQRKLYKRVLLVLSSVPIAVLVNAGRVSGTGLIAHYYGVEKAEGFYHSFASWLIFVVAILSLGLLNWLLTRPPPRDSVPPGIPSPSRDLSPSRTNELPSFSGRNWPGAGAALALASTWGVLLWLSDGMAATERHPLADFPMEIGDSWTGEALEIPEDQVEILRATDLLLRNYYPLQQSGRTPAASAAVFPRQPVVLFVAYYQTQQTGATYHSPKHCLPGSGWHFASTAKTRVPGPYGDRAEVNEAVIQNGLEQQVLLYWYQDRGRVLSSEYSAKFYLMWDALTQNRSDGALVRVSVKVETDVAEARSRALRFIGDMWHPLSRFLATNPLPEGRQAGSRRGVVRG